MLDFNSWLWLIIEGEGRDCMLIYLLEKLHCVLSVFCRLPLPIGIWKQLRCSIIGYQRTAFFCGVVFKHCNPWKGDQLLTGLSKLVTLCSEHGAQLCVYRVMDNDFNFILCPL